MQSANIQFSTPWSGRAHTPTLWSSCSKHCSPIHPPHLHFCGSTITLPQAGSLLRCSGGFSVQLHHLHCMVPQCQSQQLVLETCLTFSCTLHHEHAMAWLPIDPSCVQQFQELLRADAEQSSICGKKKNLLHSLGNNRGSKSDHQCCKNNAHSDFHLGLLVQTEAPSFSTCRASLQ